MVFSKVVKEKKKQLTPVDILLGNCLVGNNARKGWEKR